MSPINLIFDVALACGIHLKIYSSFHARFINPFSAKMFHQDGNLSTVNNKRVVPISSNLPSQMGSWQDRKKAIKSNNLTLLPFSFVNLCISFLEKFY